MLFIWRSKFNSNYGSGWIIAAAFDVAAARTQARAEFEKYLKDENTWFNDDDEMCQIKRAEFESDIAGNPEIKSNAVHFVPGSA